ncbi:Cold-regulated 413 plasma membrane protein 4 [Zea mays]|uniref:Cold-regulated 413 plasma membrane protein 4 n=1 Tax=Zea mays TaxID=4577 RepID=A0A3L6DE65_MAIZE|nr:hypothetical protein Zm00014a_011244 [Zea mays]PWZ06418.1 Cold-regulated 413 plasma membrane protein 4 [Zea mays]
MVPPPSTSADRLGPVLLGCIRDVLWHGHFLRYFSLQLIGDNSVLFHYRYLLILDRTNWKTNMLTALLVPYIFFTLPNVLFSLIRGEVGKWIAIIAVILRLFFPRHFPDWLELPGSIILLTAVAPSLFAHTFRDDLVGVFICLAIGCYCFKSTSGRQMDLGTPSGRAMACPTPLASSCSSSTLSGPGCCESCRHCCLRVPVCCRSHFGQFRLPMM